MSDVTGSIIANNQYVNKISSVENSPVDKQASTKSDKDSLKERKEVGRFHAPHLGNNVDIRA